MDMLLLYGIAPMGLTVTLPMEMKYFGKRAAILRNVLA